MRETGHDVAHVAEMGLGEAPDDHILTVPLDLGRAVCTLDGNFHTLMALAGATNPSVILIRRQHLKAPAMAKLLGEVLNLSGEAIANGALITVASNGLRIRHLPISTTPKPAA